MKKVILISIKPEWVEKILNGKKTIEIRTTVPKCGFPIDVYIYCSKGKRDLYMDTHHCCIGFDLRGDTRLNGKVVAKFTLKGADEFGIGDPYDEQTLTILDEACVTIAEARRYAGGKHSYSYGNSLYAWRISNLEVFDKQKELSEFYIRPGNSYDFLGFGMVALERAPQSWQYVGVKE